MFERFFTGRRPKEGPPNRDQLAEKNGLQPSEAPSNLVEFSEEQLSDVKKAGLEIETYLTPISSENLKKQQQEEEDMESFIQKNTTDEIRERIKKLQKKSEGFHNEQMRLNRRNNELSILKQSRELNEEEEKEKMENDKRISILSDLIAQKKRWIYGLQQGINNKEVRAMANASKSNKQTSSNEISV